MNWIYDIIGCLGAICVLSAYALLQLRKIEAVSLGYIIPNLAGAVFILVSLLDSWNLAAFLIEIAWILISFIGLYEWYTSTKKETFNKS